MAELMINNTIKIILVFFLVAVVVTGVFLFFRDTVIDFIKNLTGGPVELILVMIK